MMRFGGRRRQRMPVNAEINITNLVDVAFVLLIIFIITAPILQGGIDVNLPEADAAPIDVDDAVVVSIRADGALFVEEVEVQSLDELESVILAYVGDDGDGKPVQIKGDREVRYGRAMEVMGVLNRIGVTNIGLPVVPLPRER